VAALARVMYCIHVLSGLFISRALIQGVMGYKYQISIGEVSQLIFLFIPIFRYLGDTVSVAYRGIEASHTYSDTDTETRCRIGAS
jgi:hypothetical protein